MYRYNQDLYEVVTADPADLDKEPIEVIHYTITFVRTANQLKCALHLKFICTKKGEFGIKYAAFFGALVFMLVHKFVNF